VAPEVLYERSGYNNNNEYHCWITVRCVPLDDFAASSYANKEKCVLALSLHHKGSVAGFAPFRLPFL
jgi:hypothetical protein